MILSLVLQLLRELVGRAPLAVLRVDGRLRLQQRLELRAPREQPALARELLVDLLPLREAQRLLGVFKTLSSVVVSDFYKPWAGPISDERTVFAGRVTMVSIAIILGLMALG